MEQRSFITDCENIKQSAIKGVLSKAYEDFFLLPAIVNKGRSFPTPLTRDDFFLTTEKRMQFLCSIKPGPKHGDPIRATIQKGYYCYNRNWYFNCCAGFAENSNSPILLNPGSSILLPQKVSEIKNQNLEMSMTDIP